MAYKSGGIREEEKPQAKQPKEYFVPAHADMQPQPKKQDFVIDLFMHIPTGGSIPTTPVVDNDTLFFGACTKYFYALDAKTGKEKWKFLAGDVIFSSAVVFKDLVIFGSFDGFLYALEKETGRLRWKFRTNNRIWSSPLVVENVVYVGSTDEYLYAVAPETGQLLWKFHAQKPVSTEIAAANDMIIFGGHAGKIFSIDAKTQRLLWSYKPLRIEFPSIVISDGDKCISSFFTRSENKMPKAKDGTIYFPGLDKNLYALDLNGKERWKYLAENSGTWPNFHKGVAYFGAWDNCLYAVYNGQLYWKIRTGNLVAACPFIHNDIIYFTSMDQCLYAATLQGEVLWKLMTGGMLYSPPVVHGDVIYFGSDDTHLYAVSKETQEILWRFHTGMTTGLMKAKEIQQVINQVVDFHKRIFTVWQPETIKGGPELMTRKSYSATSQILSEAPETIYGTANPYREGIKKKGLFPWEEDKKPHTEYR